MFGRCLRRCLAPDAAAKAVRSFWLLGLLNNAPWVLMLAVATNISAGGVALVFLSNQIPGLIVKITAPYWFHLVSYRTRMLMASVSMGTACFLVGCGGLFRDEMAENEEGDDSEGGPQYDEGQRRGLFLELLGVSFVSFSCNLGEASLLALAGRFDSLILPRLSSSPDSYWIISEEQTEENGSHATMQRQDDESLFAEECESSNGNADAEVESDENENENESRLMKQEDTPQRRSITAFSSGTGLAGIVGYGYKALLSDVFGWGLTATVWSAMIFSLAYWVIYLKGLHDIERNVEQDRPAGTDESNGESMQPNGSHPPEASESSLLVTNKIEDDRIANSSLEMVHTEMLAHTNTMEQLAETNAPPDAIVTPLHLTAFERFKLILSLWPYTIPLFTVYAAEYMLQAGVWSAIGFPVESASARAQFYHYSNWTYQAGVFLSRSSGNLCAASIRALWLMPFLQVVNLYFFWVNSIHHFWYNYSLLLPCFFAGLLGGGVYVQGYSRVNADMPNEIKEFAIASVAVADSLGILVADICSLFIQSCIYKENHLEGALFDCPY